MEGIRTIEVRVGCKKCGYPGHFTYECRNFVKLDQEKAVVLDISSCSSDSEEEDDTPLNVSSHTSIHLPGINGKKEAKNGTRYFLRGKALTTP